VTYYPHDPKDGFITLSSSDQSNDNIIGDERKGHNDVFEVAIIGSGFAGLSAALLLGRYLLSTVVFDGGKTRNHKSKNLHGYLGFENSSPQQLIDKAWIDVLQYESVNVIKEKVVTIERDSDDRYFVLKTALSCQTKSVRSKYIIIATGIKDVKPDIKNFENFDGNGAWHCPHCDGFESTNKKLVIIASVKESISYAKEFLGWTKNIRLFIQEEECNNIRLTEEERSEAGRLGIDVIENDNVIEIIGDDVGKPKAVVCKSKKMYDAEIIFYHLGYDIQNQLAEKLGCELDEGHVAVNKAQQTNVPYVYAAGDIDTDRHYVVLAAASGTLAAVSIYEEILKDAIKSLKQELE
jgi:thioredoxin reductase